MALFSPVFVGHKTALMGLISILLTSPNVSAQSMTDLGTLGGETHADAVSANGSIIAGYSKYNNGEQHAFKYSGGIMTDLGTLGGTYAGVNAISADGSVIVGASTTSSGDLRGFSYSNGSMSNLGALQGSGYSYTTDVSGDGSIVVGASSFNGAEHGFKYSAGTMIDLGALGGVGSRANAISADGLVIIGTSNVSTGFTHAFKYLNGSMVDLGVLGTGSYSEANGVSSDGSVIVGFSHIIDGGPGHAFKYTGTTMTDLGTLGGDNSSAVAVSADGFVITGNSWVAGNTSEHAFKYIGTTMTDLGTLGGANSFARSISANGSVIVGDSQLSDNSSHAFKYSNGVMTDLGTLGGTTSWARKVSADGSVVIGYSHIAGDATVHAFVYSNATPTPAPMVDVQNTYAEISTNGYQLNSLLNAQNTALAINLNSDCTVYGANNVCVGVGGRYTYINNPDTSQTAGSIQLGYKVHPSLRVGAFLDQGISGTTPSNYTIKNSQPLAGLFAVYAPTGTNLGPQVKVSGAYSSNGVNITRTTMANTEGGQGTSTMTTQGAQLETAYGLAVVDNWIASPLVGVKSTQVSRNSYTETTGASFPISYNSVTQSATTAYAGVKLMGYVLPEVSIGVNAGVEQDLNSSVSNYSGSIYYLGGFSLAAPSIQKTRAFVGANTAYWLDKNERVSLGVYYNQQSLNTSNGITAMLNYTVGL